MALSLSNFLYKILPLLVFQLCPIVQCETHHFDWNIEWVTRNPDGMAERPVISINGEWPLPLIWVTKGDRVIVNVHNDVSLVQSSAECPNANTSQLGNQSTSMHWHGLFQNGTNQMDGPVGVTQCNIPPGHRMTYDFTVDQPGTYWYHSHTRGQYPDGWRGQFLVIDPENPYADRIDHTIPLTISDWYHDQMSPLISEFISYKNPTGAEPVPNSALMNDTQNLTQTIEPGKTYFFRLSNIGAFAGQWFWIEDHTMTIIEVDGVYTKPAEADVIYLTVAQRYGFLVTAKESSSRNFPMVASMDQSYFDVVPPGLNNNVTGYLVYDKSAPLPTPSTLEHYRAYDDWTLVPYDEEKRYENVGKKVELNVAMQDLGDGANYAFFNNVTYIPPVVPSLYTALSTGAAATDAEVYGDYTSSYVLKKGDVVEIIVNNNDTGKHPFHLHGHNFQVVYRTPWNFGEFEPSTEVRDFADVPMRRDTVMVTPMGNMVLRFVADNPGVWFFHCHIQWHKVTGLAAVMIEAPEALQNSLVVPENHYDMCRALDVPTRGNAAGNTVDVYNLDGQNESVAPLPSGFTAKGIVALVFSCISAFLGMAVIVWYGAAPLGSAELASAKNFVNKAGGSTT